MTYTKEYIKEIFKYIISEEEQNNNIKINANLYTIVEYYKSETLKKNLKISKPLESINHLTAPIRFGGWFNSKNKSIVIILNKIYEEINTISTDSLAYLIYKIYHELRHRYQDEKMKNKKNFKDFFIAIEKVIINNDKPYYRLNHDNFLLEIDADNDAINKTEILLKNKNIIDEISKKYINNIKESIKYRTVLYNKINMYEKFYFILEGKIKKHRKNSETPLDDSIIDLNSNIDNKEYNSMKKALSYIYNQDGSFKSIKEILDNKNEIDISIINTILCSTPFIKSIKLNTLDKSEIKYMITLLELLYQEIINKIEVIKNNADETTLVELYNEKKLAKKSKEIITLRGVLMNTLLNNKKENKIQFLYDYIKKGKSK